MATAPNPQYAIRNTLYAVRYTKYAKQTQFRKGPNKCKLTCNKGL